MNVFIQLHKTKPFFADVDMVSVVQNFDDCILQVIIMKDQKII